MFLSQSILNNSRLWRWLCLAVALFTGFFYFLKLQAGHDWGGDFSQYIAHARNIVSGLPYKATGHLQSPQYTIAPETYPVVFPLLLAPVYALFGINIIAFKTVVVLCFTGFLALLWPVFRLYLPPVAVFFITLLLALNPGLYLFKEHILSEFPFLFFMLACFYFMQRALYASNTTQSWLFFGLVGVGLFLVTGTRSAGVVLVPSWVGAMLFMKNKPKNWMWYLGFSLLICFSFLFLQSLYLNSTGESYTDQFRKMFTSETFGNNLGNYFGEAKLLWVKGANRNFTLVLLNLLLWLALAGLILRSFRNRPGVFEFFTLGSLALVMIWPWFQGFRMLIPLIPLVFFFAFYAVYHSFKRKPVMVLAVSAVLFLAWSLPYFKSYRMMETTMPVNFLRPDTGKMFDFIRSTPADARILFIKPRVLALYTGHESMVSFCDENPQALGPFLEAQQIQYVIIPKNDFIAETRCLQTWVEQNPQAVQLKFENKGFAVYKFVP